MVWWGSQICGERTTFQSSLPRQPLTQSQCYDSDSSRPTSTSETRHLNTVHTNQQQNKGFLDESDCYSNHICSNPELLATDIMATRALESRFEHLSVNDENEPVDGNKYMKSKVIITLIIKVAMLTI